MLHPRMFCQLCMITCCWERSNLPFLLEGFPTQYAAAMPKHTSIPFPNYVAFNRLQHRGCKEIRQIKSLRGRVLSWNHTYGCFFLLKSLKNRSVLHVYEFEMDHSVWTHKTRLSVLELSFLFTWIYCATHPLLKRSNVKIIMYGNIYKNIIHL